MIGVVDKFNMVDMGGIDIVESQGVAVGGLFNRLLNAIQNCRYQMLYNWKFAQIEVAPSYVELVFDGEEVKINELISVTSDDVIHIHSLEPTVVLQALSVTENGVYVPEQGVDGFNSVEVNVVTPPLLEELSVTENGTYEPREGYDGFNRVTVNVPTIGDIVEEWDYLNSNLKGSISNILPDQYVATPGASGLSIGTSGYYRLPFALSDYIFEFELGDVASASGTKRFFMCIAGPFNGAPDDGFAFSSSGRWGFYSSGWSYTELNDYTLFANSTASFDVDASGIMTVKKNGVVVAQSPDGKFSSDLGYWVIIGSSGGAYPVTIKKLTIKRKQEV